MTRRPPPKSRRQEPLYEDEIDEDEGAEFDEGPGYTPGAFYGGGPWSGDFGTTSAHHHGGGHHGGGHDGGAGC